MWLGPFWARLWCWWWLPADLLEGSSKVHRMVLRLKLLAAEVEQLAEEAYMPHTAHGCGQQDANHKMIININTKNKK